jgi:thioredoxin 1
MDDIEKIREKKMKEMMEKMTKKEPVLDKPVEVNEENFREVLSNNSLVVMDCWAPWCAPCRMIAPIIDELAKEYAGKVVFAKLNTDENPKVAAQFYITAIPTLLIFKDGKLVDQMVGAHPKQNIVAKINQYM